MDKIELTDYGVYMVVESGGKQRVLIDAENLRGTFRPYLRNLIKRSFIDNYKNTRKRRKTDWMQSFSKALLVGVETTTGIFLTFLRNFSRSALSQHKSREIGAEQDVDAGSSS